jgi:uncharacterized repeat protein (TIGR01451 family)
MSFFIKLVQSLSYSPQVASQLAFYARRLRREKLTRRISAIAGVLALGIQFAAFIAPPTAANASDENDIIRGGFASKSQMLNIYDGGSGHPGQSGPEIRAIFSHFQISRGDIESASSGRVDSRDRSLKSLGRNPSGALDQRIDIAGAGTFYLRPLYVWDRRNPYNSYPALVGQRSGAGNSFFAIIMNCGNIVIKDTPPPELTIRKEALLGYPSANSQVKPAQELGYRMYFDNLGSGQANYVTLTDAIPPNTTYKWHGTGGTPNNNFISSPTPPFPGQPGAPHVLWEFAAMPGGHRNYYVDLIVKINDNAPSGDICNVTYIRSRETEPLLSNAVCHKVIRPQAPPPPPQTLSCIGLTATPLPGKDEDLVTKYRFIAKTAASNTSISAHHFNFGDGTPILKTASPQVDHDFKKPGSYKTTVVATNGSTTTPESQDCSVTLNITQPKITLGKTAANLAILTNGKPTDATKQTAKAGDLIEYTLKTTNTGDGDKKDYVVTENINDILDYADVADRRGATQKDGILTWPKATIKAGSSLEQTFVVRIKSPIPETPRSTSNPDAFDLIINNVYGNEVSIPLEIPPAKQVEIASASLPSTGPVENALVVAFFALVVYFYFRNRQLAREIQILRVEET